MSDSLPSTFNEPLETVDPEIAAVLDQELSRQRHTLEMIASENFVPRAILEAQGSVLTNKYAEGYPGKRYYGGCEFVDIAENLAIERAKSLFGAEFANVQPHSGASASAAVLHALATPGDTILGLELAHGGHLTHGMKLNFSGKVYNATSYGVDPETMLIDMDAVRAKALEVKPTVIIAGWSAYSRQLDFAAFRAIADEVGALLMVDMAHFAGLVAGGVHPSPLPHAHVVTTTTHKTLRGGRGGMVLTMDEALGKKINSAVFPALQGGPLLHAIAGKAVALGEAQKPEFRAYARAVVDNAKALAETLNERGLDIVSGGTDTHVVLVDLRPKGLTGNISEQALERAGMTCNKNGVPFDPEKPMVTSGVRLGTPAGTSRGFGVAEFRQVGTWMADVLDGLAAQDGGDRVLEARVREEVRALCARFPIYPDTPS